MKNSLAYPARSRVRLTHAARQRVARETLRLQGSLWSGLVRRHPCFCPIENRMPAV
jgi:hypothetical protein